MEYIKNILSFCSKHLFAIILIVIIGIMAFKISKLYETNDNLGKIIAKNDSTHQTTIVTYDRDFKTLKEENRELYDSLKSYKDEVDFLLQFKYEKLYDTGIIHTNKPKQENVVVYETDSLGNQFEATEKTYEYSNNDNDSLDYNLQIGSVVEPSWYKLKIKVKDEFTIVNKSLGDLNETTIQTNGQSNISDVTMYQPKKKTSFWQRFALGPTVSCGYDVVNNKVGVNVGVGVTFNLFKNKK